jgi:hypothetical protein
MQQRCRYNSLKNIGKVQKRQDPCKIRRTQVFVSFLQLALDVAFLQQLAADRYNQIF